MLTLCTVEPRGTTATQPILPERVNSSGLDLLVSCEPSEVVACQVDHSLARRELGLGTSRADDDGDRGEVSLLLGSKRLGQRFRSPFLHELVDFLQKVIRLAGRTERGRWETHLLVKLNEVLA